MTDRQEKILSKIIREYVKTAKPVGSVFFEEKYNFDLSPATIRNEMKVLTDMGYLFQPHTSSGRVPTSKGYRFFVDSLLKKEEEKDNSIKKETLKKTKSFEDDVKEVEIKIKNIALNSSGLAFAYFFEEDFFITEGWNIVLRNPEFEEKEFLEEFISQFELLGSRIREEINGIEDFEICIGREKTIVESDNLSLIMSKNNFPGAYLGILGPSRMEYDKNINLILNNQYGRNKKRT